MMKEMRSLVAALLIFAGVVAIGVIWDIWSMLLAHPSTTSDNTR